MKLAGWVLLVGLLAASSQSRAQAQAAPNSPLTGPRWEIAGGALLLPTAVVGALTIGFLSGPGLFPCGGLLSDSDPECEKEADRKQRNAWVTGSIVGALVATVGVGLIVHGTRRLRRARALEHGPVAILPTQLGYDGYGLLAYRRF